MRIPTMFTADVKNYLSLFSSIFWDEDEVTIATTAAGSLKRPLVAHCARVDVIKASRSRNGCWPKHHSDLKI